MMNICYHRIMSIPLHHHDIGYLASNEDASSTAAAISANNGSIIDNMEGEHDEFMDALKNASRTADNHNVPGIIRRSFHDMRHVSVEFGFEEPRGCYEKA